MPGKKKSDPLEKKTARRMFHLRAGDLWGSRVHKNQKTDGATDTLWVHARREGTKRWRKLIDIIREI